MTLVERYLRAVRFFLPRRQQDDIVRELSENLASEIEERSEMLGRELSENELADILRRHGHPIVVAARYAPRQQLIGPVLLPDLPAGAEAGARCGVGRHRRRVRDRRRLARRLRAALRRRHARVSRPCADRLCLDHDRVRRARLRRQPDDGSRTGIRAKIPDCDRPGRGRSVCTTARMRSWK